MPVPHDHKFYGPLMVPTEFDDGTLPSQSSQTNNNELSYDGTQDIRNTGQKFAKKDI